MEMSDYVLGQVANERLAAAREDARRRRLVPPRPGGRSLRLVLGAWLVALGHRLLDTPSVPQVVP